MKELMKKHLGLSRLSSGMQQNSSPIIIWPTQANQARLATYYAKFHILEQINSKSYKVQSKKKRKSPIIC